MVLGDPHVQSLDYPQVMQTCDGLEHFMHQTEEDYYEDEEEEDEKEEEEVITDGRILNGTLAKEPTILLVNEMFRLVGTLARWSTDVNGTFLTSVSDK